jgi:hypothetical protein
MSETVTVTLTLARDEAIGLAILVNAAAIIRDASVDALALWKSEGSRLEWPAEHSGNVRSIPRMYEVTQDIDEPAHLDAMERATQKLRETLAHHVSIEWDEGDL